MNAFIINDETVWSRYVRGERVEITAIAPQDQWPDFEVGKINQVYYKATTPGNPSFFGIIVESIPNDEPRTMTVIIRRAAAQEIAGL